MYTLHHLLTGARSVDPFLSPYCTTVSGCHSQCVVFMKSNDTTHKSQSRCVYMSIWAVTVVFPLDVIHLDERVVTIYEYGH